MSKFLQANGDYTIKTSDGGTVLLDTGSGIGEVRITGNLNVEGETFTVSAENLNVEDNNIVLNFGEPGSGVSLRYAGIEIDRGTAPSASIIFDENDDVFNFVKGSADTANFSYAESKIRLKEILTNNATDSGDLILIGEGTGVVKVLGTVNYEDQVTQDDDIPNKKYVDDAIRNNPTFQIIDDDTRVVVTDVDVEGSESFLLDNTGFSSFGESAISVIVSGGLTAQFYRDFVQFQELEFNKNEITTAGNTNDNIVVRTQGTGKLETNYGLQLEKLTLTPAFVNGSVILHAKDPDIGDTGLYFSNSKETGELVNKNRALLFSLIF